MATFRVLHLSDTPWFRTIDADSARGAAEKILDRPLPRILTVHHHTFCDQRATTFTLADTWVTVVYSDS